MHGYRSYLWLAMLSGLMTLSGAGCAFFQQFFGPKEPPALPPSPSIEQVIQAVNLNNSRIQSFQTNQASLNGPGWPTLRASVAFERPWRLRLRGDTGLTGPEVDLGSNDELFWFWVRRNQPPALFFCRHDQFAACRARQMIPIDPKWLIEALGVAELDPSLPYQGPPTLVGPNRLEIRAVRETPTGPTTRITIIDAIRAQILEQDVYDAQGRLQASAIAEGYRRDPLTGLAMPTAVRISVPPAQFSLRIELGNVQINRMVGNPALWEMPRFAGCPAVDLCDPNLRLAPAPGPPSATAAR
ncbi:MAG: hypothetical protein ACLQLG_00315 [Thermoguttaceae bacterium]